MHETPSSSSLWAQTRQISRDPRARSCLLGLAFFMFLLPLTVLSVADYPVAGTPESARSVLSQLLWSLLGVAVGCGISALQTHSERCVGLVPYAATGFAASVGIALGFPNAGVTYFLLGATGGIAIGGIWAGYSRTPLIEKLQCSPLLPVTMTTVALVLAGIAANLIGRLGVARMSVGALLIVALLVAALSWWWLLRAALELLIEFLLWPMYRASRASLNPTADGSIHCCDRPVLKPARRATLRSSYMPAWPSSKWTTRSWPI